MSALHPARPLAAGLSRRLGAVLLSLAAAACTAPGLAPAPGPTASRGAEPLVPPPALRTEGVPPIPRALLDGSQRYAGIVGHGFVDWHPQRREMLVAHRAPGAATAQLFRLKSPLGALEPLTDGPDPVTAGRYEPVLGLTIVFRRARGGDEAWQLFRLDPETREAVQITADGQRHTLVDWVLPPRGDQHTSRLLVASVPLDRTAEGGRRERIDTTLSLIDPFAPERRRVVAELPGPGWNGGTVAPDGRRVAMTRVVSATLSEVWLIDLETGRRTLLLPRPGETQRAAHFAGEWSRDGRTLFIVSDRAGEFRELMRVAVDGDGRAGEPQRLTGHIPWDLRSTALDPAGRWFALSVNVDGRGELRLLDAASGAERPVPARPEGGVSRVEAHPASGELALQTSGPRGPGQIATLDPATGRLQAWTRPIVPPGIDLAAMPDQQIVRWTSFDGRTISGVLTLPPARFGGRRPVMMEMHGGPEGQATIGWNGRLNQLVNELGIAVFEPNVRGSSGYGKTFLDLDNGRLREDAVRDMAAALDWIATQPRLDPQRVLVTGGSYGGYMALAAATRLADRIAGAVSFVGISSFVSFLENTESYRRDLRRAEYGDERDPAMREFLQSISPLTHAGRITQPLMVVQGRNDPRVPWTESEQIVRELQRRGTPVWYLLADNEGHGFARRENADFYFAALTAFVQQTLRP